MSVTTLKLLSVQFSNFFNSLPAFLSRSRTAFSELYNIKIAIFSVESVEKVIVYTLKFIIIIATALCCYHWQTKAIFPIMFCLQYWPLLFSIWSNYIIIYSNYKLFYHVFIDLSRQNEILTHEKKGEGKKFLQAKQ